MFMPAMDYNQQLLAYLQGCRQLLDQCTAMAAAGMAFPTYPVAMPSPPFSAPGAQFMPPAPPTPTAPMPSTPPAPTDYAQQLFGYLQAWRQHLEQMAGASPGSPQPSPGQGPAAQPTNASGNQSQAVATGQTARSAGPPNAPTPPANDTGASSTLQGAARTGSEPTWPPRVALAPDSYYTSQISGTGFDPTALFEPDGPFEPFEHRPEGPQVLKEPDNYFENQFNGPRMRAHAAGPEAPAEHVVASPFLSAMERVDLTALSQVAPRSLFSTPGAQTPAARLRQVGEAPAQQ